MTTIGIISEERLKHLPSGHGKSHEFCFWLVDQMLILLRESEALGIAQVEIEFATREESHSFAAADDIFSWLEENGYENALATIVQNQTSLALFGDAISFLHAALKALEKRQFTVALALMRKPLNENLIMASWLLADPSAFYEAMTQPDGLIMSSTVPSDRSLPILQSAATSFPEFWLADPSLLHWELYDRSNERCLLRLFDKATHLTTSFKRYKTEPLNLNFVFKDSREDDLYPAIYPALAHALLFMIGVQLSLYERMEKSNTAMIEWLQTVCSGTYHSLFQPGRSHTARLINKLDASVLRCSFCQSDVTVKKQMIPRLLIAEALDCPYCGSTSQFPFHWLMMSERDESPL